MDGDKEKKGSLLKKFSRKLNKAKKAATTDEDDAAQRSVEPSIFKEGEKETLPSSSENTPSKKKGWTDSLKRRFSFKNKGETDTKETPKKDEKVKAKKEKPDFGQRRHEEDEIILNNNLKAESVEEVNIDNTKTKEEARLSNNRTIQKLDEADDFNVYAMRRNLENQIQEEIVDNIKKEITEQDISKTSKLATKLDAECKKVMEDFDKMTENLIAKFSAHQPITVAVSQEPISHKVDSLLKYSIEEEEGEEIKSALDLTPLTADYEEKSEVNEIEIVDNIEELVQVDQQTQNPENDNVIVTSEENPSEEQQEASKEDSNKSEAKGDSDHFQDELTADSRMLPNEKSQLNEKLDKRRADEVNSTHEENQDNGSKQSNEGSTKTEEKTAGGSSAADMCLEEKSTLNEELEAIQELKHVQDPKNKEEGNADKTIVDVELTAAQFKMSPNEKSMNVKQIVDDIEKLFLQYQQSQNPKIVTTALKNTYDNSRDNEQPEALNVDSSKAEQNENKESAHGVTTLENEMIPKRENKNLIFVKQFDHVMQLIDLYLEIAAELESTEPDRKLAWVYREPVKHAPEQLAASPQKGETISKDLKETIEVPEAICEMNLEDLDEIKRRNDSGKASPYLKSPYTPTVIKQEEECQTKVEVEDPKKNSEESMPRSEGTQVRRNVEQRTCAQRLQASLVKEQEEKLKEKIYNQISKAFFEVLNEKENRTDKIDQETEEHTLREDNENQNEGEGEDEQQNLENRAEIFRDILSQYFL